jgi:protoheme IX farnesyltransferase
MRHYIALTKPRVTWLIMMSAGIGYFFGLPNASSWREFLSHIHLLSLLNTIIGTALIASGTAALNQWFERDADRKMRRTAGRPLPLGRLTPGSALAFGAALSVAGFVELWLGVNLLSGSIGAFTLAMYLFLYTPLKQRTWWSQARPWALLLHRRGCWRDPKTESKRSVYIYFSIDISSVL